MRRLGGEHGGEVAFGGGFVGIGGGGRGRGGVEGVLVVFLLVSRIVHEIIKFKSVALIFTVLKL